MSKAHRSARPKGYMEWKPTPEVAYWVARSREVLEEYAGYGPMTVRQIFYRLVGNYEYDKTEPAYKRLAEYLVKARRARFIGFDKIRDDGGTTQSGDGGFDTVDEFLDTLARFGDQYRVDPSLDQPYHIEIWCEAEGMVPMLGQMTSDFGVDVTGTGGFSSLTVTHGFAARVARRENPTVLLHVGDYDPSGESIFKSMCQDIGSFTASKIGGYLNEGTGAVETVDEDPWFIPRRVALTEAQVDEYDLPTAPPKASDSRSINWVGETTQAEAMPPDLLNDIIRGAVTEWYDQGIRDANDEREGEERETIGTRVEDAIEVIREDLS